jgi:hypothetical protein
VDDHPSRAQLITERLEQLARYRAVYAETYGHQIDPTRHEAQDERLAELRRTAS